MLGSTAAAGVILWTAGAWLWPGAWFWVVLIPSLLIWGWSIAFFRDPVRSPVGGLQSGDLCAPADGRVMDISELDGYGLIDGPAVRIGIFLSLFNVHINRSPCAGRVLATIYRPGAFLAAMRPEAGERNESNTVILATDDPVCGPVVVRQVAGYAARRIVSHAQEGMRLETGERFGLIKYGSRTELIVPKAAGLKVLVAVGDKVRAGETILMRCSTDTIKGQDGETSVEDVAGFSRPASTATA